MRVQDRIPSCRKGPTARGGEPYGLGRRWVSKRAPYNELYSHRELGERLLLVSLDWPGILSPFKRAELTDSEEAWLSEFRCQRARCAVPAERLIVMSAVRQVWGGEAAFEAFVHEELPRVLAESKRRYSSEFARVALRAVDTMFGG